MTDTEIVEAGELELYEPRTPTTLFHTDDPAEALAQMVAIAKPLFDVIERQHLYVNIRGKRHISLEGWATLGAMCGVHAIVTETRPNEAGDGIIAHAEARTLAGQLVGAADGECSRAEQRWRNAEPFAIRSMASTRAMSRALRAPLGQIVVLAGYEPGVAEEMPIEDATVVETDKGKIPPELRPTDEQGQQLRIVLHDLAELDPGRDWKAAALNIAGIPDWGHATATIVGDAIEKLETVRAKLLNEAAA